MFSCSRYFIVPLFVSALFSTCCHANFMVGQIVEFGHYSLNKTYSREPISFIVLDETQDKVLLLSEKGIDAMPYHSKNEAVTWEHSSVRRWLNKEFLESAFSTDELESILLSHVDTPDNDEYGTDGGFSTDDFVFLLSQDEADKYFMSADERAALMSKVTKDKVFANENGNGDWWLRSPGGKPNRASYVREFGKIHEGGCMVADEAISVRPAVWVKKSYFEDGSPRGVSASRVRY